MATKTRKSMSVGQVMTTPPRWHKGKHIKPTPPTNSGSLSFITSEGESITFPPLEMALSEATAIAGEEALGKIWNRPTEDLANPLAAIAGSYANDPNWSEYLEALEELRHESDELIESAK